MPVTRLPVKHTFGLLSHGYRLDIQEHMIHEQWQMQETTRCNAKSKYRRNPLELTEKRIKKYRKNNEKLPKTIDQKALQILMHIGRKISVSDGIRPRSANDYHESWLQLCQLTSCAGKLQDAALNLLVASLTSVPLLDSLIPSLFYVLENSLYCIQTEMAKEPSLGDAEIKLLKVGQLASMRLYTHYVAGQIGVGYQQYRTQLRSYLQGLAEKGGAYSGYPDSEFSVHSILEVGAILSGPDCLTMMRTASTAPDAGLFHEADVDYNPSSDCGSTYTLHGQTSTLFHALELWEDVVLARGHHKLRSDASELAGPIVDACAKENWLTGAVTMAIVGAVARVDPVALRQLQRASCTGLSADTLLLSELIHRCQEEGERTQEPTSKERNSASASRERNMEPTNWEKNMEPASREKNMEPTNREKNMEPTSREKNMEPVSREKNMASASHSNDSANVLAPAEKASPERSTAASTAAERSDAASESIPASSTPPAGRPGPADAHENPTTSSAPPLGRPGPPAPHKNPPTGPLGCPGPAAARKAPPALDAAALGVLDGGVAGWSWQLGVCYALTLADVCENGATAETRRAALLGEDARVDDVRRRRLNNMGASGGLLDLLAFQGLGASCSWAWKVRYTAVQALVRIYGRARDPTQQGMRTVAWNALMTWQTCVEWDQRVLDASRTDEFLTHGEAASLLRELPADPTKPAVSLAVRIAEYFHAVHTLPLPPPSTPTPPSGGSARDGKRSPMVPHATPIPDSESPVGCARPSRKCEATIDTGTDDLYSRNTAEFRKVISQEWQKEVKRMEEEEKKKHEKESEKKAELDGRYENDKIKQ